MHFIAHLRRNPAAGYGQTLKWPEEGPAAQASQRPDPDLGSISNTTTGEQRARFGVENSLFANRRYVMLDYAKISEIIF